MTLGKGIYVVGGGGHGKVILATLREAGRSVAGVLDDNPALQGESVLGTSVLGPLSLLDANVDVEVVLAMGDNDCRQKLAGRFKGVRWATVIHPRAYVDPSVSLGAGSVVLAGAVIQPGTVIGRHCIVNTGATVDHDCRLDDFVHVAPGVHLAGGVTVGRGTLLGIGSSVIPGMVIGEGAIVGAGAAVTRPVPGHMVAMGVPARVRRKVT